MAALTAAVATTTAIIGTGAAAYNSYLGWEAAQDAKQDQKDLKKLNEKQASDIITQIENEDFIYKDELDMISKQTALVEDKLLLQTRSAFEQTGDTLSNVVAGTYESKYQSGASEKTRREARGKYKEETSDLTERFESGLKEIELQNEMKEKDAERRHEQIIGSLEATYMELTGNSMPDATNVTQPPISDDLNEEELDDLFADQADQD